MPLNDGKLLITSHTNAGGAAKWLRLGQPLDTIGRADLAHVHMLDPTDDGRLAEDAMSEADVVCSGHATSPESARSVLALIEGGKKYMWDADDLPDGVSPYNPAYRAFGLEEVKVETS